MNSTIAPLPTVPLGREAHHFAQRFSAQQATPYKGKQVYLNTLAVYAVHHYCNYLDIETDLQQSDSWHPIKQAVFDTADLYIPRVGRVECRAVLPNEERLTLPSGFIEERIGYVGVQLSDRLDAAQILGFLPALDRDSSPEQIAIADLQPFETFIEYINLPQASAASVSPTQQRVNLGQWLEQTFEAGWQTIEALLSQEQRDLIFSFRSVQASSDQLIRRGKLIKLGMDLAEQSAVLMVALTPVSEEEFDVRLQLHPSREATYLPTAIQLIVLDELDEPVMQAQARNTDNYIQLDLGCSSGESFSVQVVLGEVSVTETFLM